MATSEKVAASANDEREISISRLIRIDGIARKTAEAMYEIGIYGYADLVRYLSQRTAQQVSAELNQHGVKRPPAFIAQATWVRQAREFGELENIAATRPEADTKQAEKPAGAPASLDAQEHDAVFTVSFDVKTDGVREPVLLTTVCDRTNGGHEGVFQGSDTATWVNWILDRADLPSAVQSIAPQAEMNGEPPSSEIEAAEPPVSVESNETRIEIDDIQLCVVEPTVDDPEKRLKAEINFQLSGAGAETLASKGIPFRIEGYTVDTESGIPDLVVSDRRQLVPEVFKYVGQQEFGIPEVGHYEFHSIVLLLPPVEMTAYHQGPTLRVVP